MTTAAAASAAWSGGDLVVGARASRLSVAQTGQVTKALEAELGCGFETRGVSTGGDTDARPLFAIDRRGIFSRELDGAVLRGDVDFAVHSLKDVPSVMADGLVLACVPARGPVHDVFVSGSGDDIDSIADGSVVGTSSLRRAVQVSARRPGLVTRPIRGNVDTRIAMSGVGGGGGGGGVDAVVLAEAGLSRLGADVVRHALPVEDFVPSPGQGALAVVCRRDGGRVGPRLVGMLQSIEDAGSRSEVEAERALSESVESGCRFPVGALGRVVDGGSGLVLRATASSVDGSEMIAVEESGLRDEAVQIGRRAGRELQKRGVAKLALNWRAKVDEWNKRGR